MMSEIIWFVVFLGVKWFVLELVFRPRFDHGRDYDDMYLWYNWPLKKVNGKKLRRYFRLW
jgi:hypothetical protein